MRPSHIEKAIFILNSGQFPASPESHIAGIDSRALLFVTLLYLVALLSVPLHSAGMLIWFASYPIVTAPLGHIAYEKIFLRSLIILPLLIAIGIFNPIYDQTTAFKIGNITISEGWISVLSIIIRGLLSMQALLLLIHVAGFNNICAALRALHFPKTLITQILMAYRYMSVLLEEALAMHRARISRGYGRRSYPLSMWGSFVGQLLIRSIERSKRIFAAMQTRGFNGSLTVTAPSKWTTADTLYCVIWITAIGIMRLTDLSTIFLRLIHR